MARNLKYQFRYAIEKSFNPNGDKHSFKHNKANDGNKGSKTFSYADRKNLLDVSANFSNWMRENHSEIKELKDINSSHIQDFLNEKAQTCSNQTINQYKSKFSKLEKLVNNTYTNANVNYTNTVTPTCSNNTEKLRSKTMTDSDYNKLNNYMSNNCRSDNGAKALQLSYHAGLRVAECAKLQQRDIKINPAGTTATVSVIGGKGGRNREVKITNKESVQALIQIRDSVENPTDRVVPIKPDSINKAINRAMDKCNMQEYKAHKTSVHSLRKAFAQREYNKYKEELEPKQAWDKVSQQLGHGKNRDDLYKAYIENK